MNNSRRAKNEGKDRIFINMRKSEENQKEKDRLPNEFKHCLDNYNYYADMDIVSSDYEDYSY